MGDIGDIIMDKDAMYVDIPDAHVRFTNLDGTLERKDADKMVRHAAGAVFLPPLWRCLRCRACLRPWE